MSVEGRVWGLAKIEPNLLLNIFWKSEPILSIWSRIIGGLSSMKCLFSVIISSKLKLVL